MTETGRRARLAWALGAAGLVACALGASVVLALGAPRTFLAIFLVGALMGVLGALVAAREPANSIGWLMCSAGIGTGLLNLPAGYAYFALVTEHATWPLGPPALWLGAWTWVFALGVLPLISARFPDGKMPRRWALVDWTAIAGPALFAAGIALNPAAVEIQFTPLPEARLVPMLPYAVSPLALLPHFVAVWVQSVGLVLLVLAYVGSAATVVNRLRRATGDVRLQLEWFAYAGSLVSAAVVYGAFAYTLFGQSLYLALTPLIFAALAIPIAIAIAILRYRLYDIDLLINRTLVYAGLTAVLGALYAALVTFLNRLFISLSGQKTDVAYVITAFVVAVSFGPVKDWLQRQVDRGVGRTDAVHLLDSFRSDVDEIVAVMDVDRAGRELLDRAVAAFNARWAAFYVAGSDAPAYTQGDTRSAGGLEVSLRYDGRDLGRLVMGERHGGASYGERDQLALQRSADSVAQAIALAARLGHAREPVTVR